MKKIIAFLQPISNGLEMLIKISLYNNTNNQGKMVIKNLKDNIQEIKQDYENLTIQHYKIEQSIEELNKLMN